jgi:hypothetical protein
MNPATRCALLDAFERNGLLAYPAPESRSAVDELGRLNKTRVDKAVEDFDENVRNRVKGWQLVQAICDYVNEQLQFGYRHANPDENRMASLRRATGCVPGFCPSCNHFVPLHEYSSAVGPCQLIGFKVLTDEVRPKAGRFEADRFRP